MITVELTELDLRELIKKHLEEKFTGLTVDVKDIQIQVKSKQNYRAEWESAAFRGTISIKH